MPPEPIVVRRGRLIDPVQGLDQPVDLLLEGGLVASVERPGAIDPGGRRVFEAAGMWILPGLIDLHVHLRDPGQEYKEDLASGLAAAAAGGFTAVVSMPNTSPPVDRAAMVEDLRQRAAAAGGARLWPAAAMTRGREGGELCEYDEIRAAGAVAVTDDGAWVADAAVMRRILDYAGVCGLTPMSHCEEPTLAPQGLIHEGRVSTRLGLAAQPAAVEEMAVFRDLALSKLTGRPLHICHVSSAGTADLIRRAKGEGVPVTCETAPHYLHLTDEDLGDYDPNRKMKPPLRTARDRAALRAALADGTIDAVATDHAPHSVLEKQVEFSEAAFGVIGLETAFSLIFELIASAGLTPARLVEVMSANPARIINVPGGTLKPGAPADLTVVDPAAEFVWSADGSKSKSRNSPFDGRAMRGLVVGTMVAGEFRHLLQRP
jgi:dihydroorotase